MNPQQLKDCSIMDDVLAMQVPQCQAQQIQYVCLFLCVSMLSKIMDCQGTHISPAMLYPVPTAHYHQSYQHNTSTFQWPQIYPPGPAAWKQWPVFIPGCTCYQTCCTSSTTLAPGYLSATVTINGVGRSAYVHMSWFSLNRVSGAKCYYPTHVGVLMPMQSHIHSQRNSSGDILFAHKIHVPLSIMDLFQPIQLAPAYLLLASHVTITLDTWADPLWLSIQLHAHTETLHQAIITRQLIHLFSNAAVHPTG